MNNYIFGSEPLTSWNLTKWRILSSLILHNHSCVVLAIKVSNTRNKLSHKSICFLTPESYKLHSLFFAGSVSNECDTLTPCECYVPDLFLFIYFVEWICFSPLPWPSVPFCDALWLADGAMAQLWQIRSSFYIVVFNMVNV